MLRKLFTLLPFLCALQTVSAQNTTVKQYIDSFKNIAMKEMIEYKIPASITLAQGLLESGSGNSRLAKTGNNHFGIKCKKDWTGCTILEDDDALQECFRCYANAEESYKDHSRFLKENKRYAALFELNIADYRGWARGLLAAGYATNQKYADLLIGTIERNRLQQFDSMVLNGYNPYNTAVKPNIDIVYNRVPSTVVQPNQSLEQVAEANHKSTAKLYRYNDLGQHRQIAPGDVLYLKPKKRKASVPSHTVENGETMWEISQKYAIKISALYKKNLMVPGTEPKPGVMLHLRDKAESRPDTGRYIPEAPMQSTSVVNADVHTVSKGETLYSIARLYGISVDNLKSWNNLNGAGISEGQKLIVRKQAEAKTGNPVWYTVQAGDTLYSIARKFGISIQALKSLNKLEGDSIYNGMKLQVGNQ